MTTWYMGGGVVRAVLRSATTAPCPSPVRDGAAGSTGGFGGSEGMHSFYRLELCTRVDLHIAPACRELKREIATTPRSHRGTLRRGLTLLYTAHENLALQEQVPWRVGDD